MLKLFHLIAAAQFFFGVYYEHVHVLPEEVKLRKFSFGGKLIYLTFLNAVSSEIKFRCRHGSIKIVAPHLKPHVPFKLSFN